MRVHYSWYIAIILITIVVTTQFPEAYPLWQKILLGLLGSFLFLMAIGLREVGLYFLAQRRGMVVKKITLFIFGSVNKVSKESALPIMDLLMGMAGIISNLFLAIMFYFIYLALVSTGSIMVASIIQWLAFVCFALTFMHFIPAFPLDGGKMLRAFLWRASGNFEWATRLILQIGWYFWLVVIAAGVVLLFVGDKFTGFTLIFIGWVLFIAVRYSRRQALLRSALEGVPIGRIVEECPTVKKDVSLDSLVREWVLNTGKHCFIVMDGFDWEGVITLDKIQSVPARRWSTTPVAEVMIPAASLIPANESQSAAGVLDQMEDLDVGQMVVLSGNKVSGIIARDSLLQLAGMRARLQRL